VALLAGACSVFGGRKAVESPEARMVREAAEARIRGEVEARIAAEPSLAGARVRVEVNRGREVGLYGTVPGIGALRCVVTNAELVPGVSLVIDHVELQPGPPAVPCRAPRVFPATPPS
jgi:osmotically-inducible protein OsmY